MIYAACICLWWQRIVRCCSGFVASFVMRYSLFFLTFPLLLSAGAAFSQTDSVVVAPTGMTIKANAPVLRFGLRAGGASESMLPNAHFQSYKAAGGASIQAGGFVEWLSPVPRLALRFEALARREWLTYESVQTTGKATVVLKATQRYRVTDLRLTPIAELQLMRPDKHSRWVGLLVGASFPVALGNGQMRGERFKANSSGLYGNNWSAEPCDTTYTAGSRPKLVVGISLHLSPALDLTLRGESNGKRPYYGYSNGGLFGSAYATTEQADMMALNLSVGYRFNSPRVASQ